MTVVALRPHQAELGSSTKYVRLREQREDGFVIFDFSIGDPQLAVELILPASAYREFCSNNRVVHLSAAQAAQIDREALKWRYGQPGIGE
ncbi:MAG: phenol 2-monooxygenase [Nevskia sp.]